MLAFFRRILNKWWVGGILALAALAIVVTGVGTPGGGGGLFGNGRGAGGGGDTVARMKSGNVGSEEVLRRAQDMFQQARGEQPKLDLAGFIAGGGVDAAVRAVITQRAMEAWADSQNMRASDRQIEGAIASISAFNGPDGKFDPKVFRQLIAQRHLSEAQVRSEFATEIVRRQLLSPVAGGARAPLPLVSSFVAMLLETRSASIAMVPAAALPGGPGPSDAEIKLWYARHLARYSLPEQRVIRYAPVGLDQVADAAKPNDAEIAAYYQAHAADYAAREDRSFSRIVFPDEAAAKAFVAKVRGGTTFAAAAQAAGFSPANTMLGKLTQPSLAAATTPEVAKAAFAVPQGGLTDPLKAPLGWFVVRADTVTKLAARSLDAARPEIALALAKQKGLKALADLVDKLQGAVDQGATFDDLVKAHALQAVATPPIVSAGLAPADPAFRPSPILQPLLKAAFQAEADDQPTVETLGQDRFALLKVGQIIAAAPQPLARMHDAVARDIRQDRALARAKAIADAIVAKVDAGAPLPTAMAGAGVALPPAKGITARQFDLARFQQQGRTVPPGVTAMFRLAPGKAITVPEPSGAGWLIVRLDKASPAGAADIPALAAASRRDFDQAFSNELVEQFANALIKAEGVQTNRDAVARLKTRLAGGVPEAE